MSEARREQFEKQAEEYFPDCTAEEKAAWVESCVLTHPGHDNENTFRPKDFEALFARQSNVYDLLMKMEDATGRNHAELLAAWGEYARQDATTQAAILAGNIEDAEQSKKQAGLFFQMLLTEFGGTRARMSDAVDAIRNHVTMESREPVRLLWWCRVFCGAAALGAVVAAIELGVMIAR